MNQDIRLSVGYWDHWKTKKLVQHMGWVGPCCHIRLLCEAGKAFFDGVFKGTGEQGRAFVEVIAEWDGEPGALIDGLILCGQLEELPDGRLKLHDWEKWNNFAATFPLRSARAIAANAKRWGKTVDTETSSTPQPQPQTRRPEPRPAVVAEPRPRPAPAPEPAPEAEFKNPLKCDDSITLMRAASRIISVADPQALFDTLKHYFPAPQYPALAGRMIEAVGGGMDRDGLISLLLTPERPVPQECMAGADVIVETSIFNDVTEANQRAELGREEPE